MRKSVERQRLTLLRTTSNHKRRWRRSLLWFLVLLIAVGCGLFLAYHEHQQEQREAAVVAQRATDKKQLADLVATLKQQRIDAAKAAEAAAKAKAKQTAAAKKAEAAAHPSGTTSTVACDVTTPTSITVILNKKHCFDPITWAPNDLVSVNGFLMRSEAAQHMKRMMAAATQAGDSFQLSSAYRSYSDQQATYNYWVHVNGSQAAADTVSARPGFSEHQTGLAADLKVGSCVLECFATTAQYTWLTTHAADYGFIQRYPEGLTSITGYSPEAWHWRYVGTTTAEDMKAKGIQTLEQYFGVSGGDYS